MIKLFEFHPAQQKMYDERKRYNVALCGRRLGKSLCAIRLCIDTALDGFPVGWYSPAFKYSTPIWEQFALICKPFSTQINKNEQRITLVTGGTIEVFSLDTLDSGRGRKFKRVVIDEAAFVSNLEYAWNNTIRPTLSDLRGDAWFLSTPRGRDYLHTLFLRGQLDENGKTKEQNWKSWRLPTSANPYIPADEIEEAKRSLPEAVFRQEYEAYPAETGGCPFEQLENNHTDDLPGVTMLFGVDVASRRDYTVIIGIDERGIITEIHRFNGPWNTIEEKILEVIGNKPTLIDETGAGVATVESIMRQRPNVRGFNYSSRKQDLMEHLRNALYRQEIRWNQEKVMGKMLLEELKIFRYEYKPGGKITFEGQKGYDDMVNALALMNKMRRDVQGQQFSIKSLWDDDDDDYTPVSTVKRYNFGW